MAGHEVAFATGAELAPEVARRGLQTWRLGPSRAETDASVRAAHPNLAELPVEERTQVVIQGVFVESAAKRAIELLPRVQQWKPDIVVHEITELAGALAAAHTGARHVVHASGSCRRPSCGRPGQFMNAAACQAAGVALTLAPDEFSADAVAEAAERLITEPTFTRAAGRIRAEIDAMPTAADVLTGLLTGDLVPARG
jgi:hypothetical protein